MKEIYTFDNNTEKSGNAEMREEVQEMIMKATMTTGMWKQLLRKMVAERPEMTEWLHQNLSEHVQPSSDTNDQQTLQSTMMMGIEGQSAIAQQSDDPLHEELMGRLDTINEDELLSCQSNALWVFRLMMQMGNLEKALTAAEMDKSVFLRNITEALGYDEGERFRIYNYLRRYEK